jgi:hypothetical protein
MSPEMLTLVAAVLAYDIPLETCDCLSSVVEVEAFSLRATPLASRNDKSCTRLEKDMMMIATAREHKRVSQFEK